MSVKVVTFEELSKEEQEEFSYLGREMDFQMYLVIEDSDGKRIYSDKMEPEDASFGRDLSWIKKEIEKAQSRHGC